MTNIKNFNPNIFETRIQKKVEGKEKCEETKAEELNTSNKQSSETITITADACNIQAAIAKALVPGANPTGGNKANSVSSTVVAQQIVEDGGEHFQDVYNEMLQNVPAVTTTIEEKELALSYINRMLACHDMPSNLRPYWENKKVILQNEIQNIINQQNVGNDTNFAALEAEFWNYSNSVWNRPVEFNNVPDRVEYWISYYNTCISYIDRLLNCQGITPEKQAQYQAHRMSMLFDLNYQKRDLNRYNSEHGQQTESFYNVFAEFENNVPDQTTTIREKQLALSYIDRMLSCSDITPELRTYWENKKVIIQNEIQNIINSQNIRVSSQSAQPQAES